MLQYKIVESEDDIKLTAELADIIWHEHYSTLISVEQIDYMVNNFQSVEAIKNHIANENFTYKLLLEGDQPVGYIGIVNKSEDVDYLFLSKCYLLSDVRGKGYGYETFKHVVDIAKERSLKSIRLTVNKHNEIALNAYKSWGMQAISSVEVDIGQGFIMDDYVMEYEI